VQICYAPIPTVFLPNSESENNVFHPLGNIMEIEIFKIYNRWGEMVFEAKTPTDTWNGTFRGSEMPSDVYIYFIQAKVNGEVKLYKGDVTLIR
jgi:gliding motility-associated-like protein